MSPKYARANQHKRLRRKLFQLVKQQQTIEKKLNKYDSDIEFGFDAGGYNVETTVLSNEYQRLGREIDTVHTKLLRSIP